MAGQGADHRDRGRGRRRKNGADAAICRQSRPGCADHIRSFESLLRLLSNGAKPSLLVIEDVGVVSNSRDSRTESRQPLPPIATNPLSAPVMDRRLLLEPSFQSISIDDNEDLFWSSESSNPFPANTCERKRHAYSITMASPVRGSGLGRCGGHDCHHRKSSLIRRRISPA
jgi:hypothetical protein